MGCGSLHSDYVAADRATYDACAPVFSAAISHVGSESLEGRSWSVLQKSWDGRIKAGESKIAQQEAE